MSGFLPLLARCAGRFSEMLYIQGLHGRLSDSEEVPNETRRGSTVRSQFIASQGFVHGCTYVAGGMDAGSDRLVYELHSESRLAQHVCAS